MNDDRVDSRRHCEKPFYIGGAAQISFTNLHAGGKVLCGGIVGEYKGTNGTMPVNQLPTDLSAQKSGGTGQKIDSAHKNLLFVKTANVLFSIKC